MYWGGGGGRPVCVCTLAHVRGMSGCVCVHVGVSVCVYPSCVYMCACGGAV